MSSKPTQTHTLSFTIISRMQCWLYSIRGQIIMSHYFHIKKKSIIVSIVLVRFLTVVRWMYNIPSERCNNTSGTHLRVRDACVTRDPLRKLQFSKLTPKKFVESAHTKPRISMIAICFGIHLSFTMSNMLCVHGPRVLHNKHFQTTLISNNIRPILFELRGVQYIQYNMELHIKYWQRPETTRES